jgi:hypothetical protein
MNQLAISFVDRASFARKLGTEAGNAAADKAEQEDPLFKQRALEFIVAYIRQQGEARGEEATLAAVLNGIKPRDQRSFGPVYKKALRLGLIRIVGYVPRVRGHGSAGGKLYAAGHAG